MSVLMVNEDMDFVALRELMGISDGNLASHIKALEKMDYIKVRKKFVGKKPNTSYAASQKGRKAFSDHLAALEKLIKRP